MQANAIQLIKDDVQLLRANPAVTEDRALIILSAMTFNAQDEQRDPDSIVDKIGHLKALISQFWATFNPPWDPTKAAPTKSHHAAKAVKAYKDRRAIATSMTKFAQWLGPKHAQRLRITDTATINHLAVLARFAMRTDHLRLEFLQKALLGQNEAAEALWPLYDRLLQNYGDDESEDALEKEKQRVRLAVFSNTTMLRVTALVECPFSMWKHFLIRRFTHILVNGGNWCARSKANTTEKIRWRNFLTNFSNAAKTQVCMKCFLLLFSPFISPLQTNLMQRLSTCFRHHTYF